MTSAEKRTTHTIGRDPAAIRADLESRDLLGVAAAIAAHHHITLDELLGVSRRVPFPAARRHFWLELTNRGWSSRHIGVLVGRHNASVLEGVNRLMGELSGLGLCVHCAGSGAAAGTSGARCELCLGSGKGRRRSA